MDFITAVLVVFLGAFGIIIYQMFSFKRMLLLSFGVRSDIKKGRSPKLLKRDPVKRKPRVIDESKLVKKESN